MGLPRYRWWHGSQRRQLPRVERVPLLQIRGGRLRAQPLDIRAVCIGGQCIDAFVKRGGFVRECGAFAGVCGARGVGVPQRLIELRLRLGEKR
jgi:hypothetical protein